jgi:hypothetical protein
LAKLYVSSLQVVDRTSTAPSTIVNEYCESFRASKSSIKLPHRRLQAYTSFSSLQIVDRTCTASSTKRLDRGRSLRVLLKLPRRPLSFQGARGINSRSSTKPTRPLYNFKMVKRGYSIICRAPWRVSQPLEKLERKKSERTILVCEIINQRGIAAGSRNAISRVSEIRSIL